MNHGNGSLGVYVDCSFGLGGDELLVHPEAYGFVTFVESVARRFRSHTYLARRSEALADLVSVNASSAEWHPLPGYSSLTDLGALVRSARRTTTALWRGLDDVDTVWVFGPSPYALVLAILAMVRRRRVVLGVRQDSMAYFRTRLPSRRWLPVLLPLAVLDRLFLILARLQPVTVVGRPLAERYGGPRAGVLDMVVTLIRRSDRRPAERFGSDGPIRLLSVGRLAPEKNPLLLLEVVADLDREAPGRFTLSWIGSGAMRSEVAERATSLGIDHLLDLPGFVPFGPKLIDRYADADVFVHTSLTEGSPQVLYEAAAVSLPIVATDVGGVRAAMGEGRCALLVPPDDRRALTDAILRMADDHSLRVALSEEAGRLADRYTIESESARVASFLAGSEPSRSDVVPV